MIDRAALIAAGETAPDIAHGYLASLPRFQSDADALAHAADCGHEVIVQRVHGNLNLDKILRWAGGLMITDFVNEPDPGPLTLGLQPPFAIWLGCCRVSTPFARVSTARSEMIAVPPSGSRRRGIGYWPPTEPNSMWPADQSSSTSDCWPPSRPNTPPLR